MTSPASTQPRRAVELELALNAAFGIPAFLLGAVLGQFEAPREYVLVLRTDVLLEDAHDFADADLGAIGQRRGGGDFAVMRR